MIGLLAASILSLSAPFDPQLELLSVGVHDWGVEFVSGDGQTQEVERFVIDPFLFVLAADPITIDDCVNSAIIACGAAGVKRVMYRQNPTTGEYTCDFECNPGTGTGG